MSEAIRKNPWRVWPITEHPSKGQSTESFATKALADARAIELTSNGDAWLIGVFDGYDDNDWARFAVRAIAYDGGIFQKR